MRKLVIGLCFFTSCLAGCSSTVVVRKDSCKDIFDGLLMECEQVKK